VITGGQFSVVISRGISCQQSEGKVVVWFALHVDDLERFRVDGRGMKSRV
jgi:hypothetical protein